VEPCAALPRKCLFIYLFIHLFMEDDDDGKAYPLVLQQLWISILRQISPQVAQACDALGSDFSYKVRYHDNIVKVWYAPRDFITAGLTTPLAEQPTVKDKWVSHVATVLTYPPVPNYQAEDFARILFRGRLQERCPDPEVQGGKIGLIASKNNIVQRRPNSLDRMHASLPKQVAYNQRVLSAEDEIAGINTEVGSFLSKMSATADEPIVIFVNAGESLKRHEQHVGGQLWLQSDRQMTATNIQFDGMSNMIPLAINTLR
jgi:hypothetical protein